MHLNRHVVVITESTTMYTPYGFGDFLQRHMSGVFPMERGADVHRCTQKETSTQRTCTPQMVCSGSVEGYLPFFLAGAEWQVDLVWDGTVEYGERSTSTGFSNPTSWDTCIGIVGIIRNVRVPQRSLCTKGPCPTIEVLFVCSGIKRRNSLRGSP